MVVPTVVVGLRRLAPILYSKTITTITDFKMSSLNSSESNVYTSAPIRKQNNARQKTNVTVEFCRLFLVNVINETLCCHLTC